MRIVWIVLLAVVCMAAGAQPSDLERLKRELKVAAPPEHYPDYADYLLLPKVCNEKICFKVLAARFVAAEGKTIRLAIFSEDEHYIGSYVGLNLMPTRVEGATLHFPATKQVNRIRFNRTSPPSEIQLDNESHAFRWAR